MSISRRQFTAGVALISATSMVRAQPLLACLTKARAGRVDIDAHCHVFNGSDLQVEKFLADVVARERNAFLRKVIERLALPLQRAAWRRAPLARNELVRLQPLGEGNTKVSDENLAAAYASAVKETDTAYSEGFAAELNTPEGRAFLDAYREYLQYVAAQSLNAAKTIQLVQPESELEKLNDPARLLRQIEHERELEAYSINPVFDFIRRFFAYRFEQVYYLLHNYGCEHGTVQMIAPAVVDYDYPLGAGNMPTPSPLPDQFQVMARISEVFGGRVMTYLPFDPWRVASGDSVVFAALQDHIARGAATGIKLYPPMGFAPLGNAALAPPPHSWPKQPDFPARLDAAMTSLWDFATALDVPVLAHSAMSNAPAADRLGLGKPDNWLGVFAKYPRARVCFGHFGGQGLLKAENEWPQRFLELVTQRPNAFGDISYFDQILSLWSDDELVRRLADFVAAHGDAKSKTLYGSDWLMLAIESRAELYFSRFAKALGDPKLFAPDVAARVLGANAADFLGLHSGHRTRSRLEVFYGQHSVSASWLKQIV